MEEQLNKMTICGVGTSKPIEVTAHVISQV